MRGVETFRIRKENALAYFGAEINRPPVELRLRITGWITGDSAVADDFMDCLDFAFNIAAV